MIVYRTFRHVTSNRPAAGVAVTVVERDGDEPVQVATTDALGAVAFDVPSGNYDFLAMGVRVPFDVSTSGGTWSPSLPGGGTSGQVLAKASDADQDTVWVDAPTGGPGGGPVRGNGFPTGAPAIGTEYVDEDETNGALRWTYTSRGWVVTVGDTGWRDVRGLFSNVNGDPKARVYLRRTQEGVTMWVMAVQTVVFEDTCFATVPEGWRATPGHVYATAYGYGFDYFDGQASGQIGVGSDTAGTGRPDRLFIRCGNGYRDIKAAQLTYHPDDAVPWPSVLPGVAVNP